MVNRSGRAAIAQQTLEILERGEYLDPDGTSVRIGEQLEAARRDTRLFTPDELDDVLADVESHGQGPADFRVENSTTLAGARRLIEQGMPDARQALVDLGESLEKMPRRDKEAAMEQYTQVRDFVEIVALYYMPILNARAHISRAYREIQHGMYQEATEDIRKAIDNLNKASLKSTESTKAGFERLSASLYHELEPDGIRVSTIRAGAMYEEGKTWDVDMDAAIAFHEAATAAGVFCNSVDDKSNCSYITPAIVDRSPIVVAISSGGAAPVLARQLRAKIEMLLPTNFGRLASLARDWRARVAGRIDSLMGRRRFWEAVFDGPVRDLAIGEYIDKAERAMAELLTDFAGRSRENDIRPLSIAGWMPRDAGRTTTDRTASRDCTSTFAGRTMSQQAKPASSVWSIGR